MQKLAPVASQGGPSGLLRLSHKWHAEAAIWQTEANRRVGVANI